MQRGVLLGAGAVVLVVAGALGLRAVTHRQAGQALDHGIEEVLADLPPGYAVKHGATEYNPLTASLTVHDVSVSHDGAPLVAADEVTLAGLDQQALHDVFEPSNYPNGHPAWTDRRLLIADASATGVHWAEAAPGRGDVRVRHVTLHRLSGRPFAVPPTPENLATNTFRADAALALALDSLAAHGLEVLENAPTAIALKLGEVSISDYDAGKLGSAALRDAALDAAGKTGDRVLNATMDHVQLTAVDARAALEALRQPGHANTALGATTYAAANAGDLAIRFTAGPVITMRDLHFEQGAADAAGVRTGSGWLHGMVLALGQTVVPPSLQPGLSAFGLNTITLDIEARATSTTPPTRSEIVEDWELHDLGTLHLAAGIGNLGAAASAQADPLAPALAMTLDHAEIAWKDAGLAKRLFATAAAQMHSTPELIRAQLAVPVATLGLMLPGQPDAADQMNAFLNNPQTLTVTMTPPQKVTFGEIAAAPLPARAQLMGVHVTGR